MPELPEVEVTRRGLAPAIVGRSVTAVNVRTPKLREPLQDLAALLPGIAGQMRGLLSISSAGRNT